MLNDVRSQMRALALQEEGAALERVRALAHVSPGQRATIAQRAADLVRDVRAAGAPGIMESFLTEYGLSTREGVALMCLAEALLRVPDAGTIDALIQDKIVPHDWGAHIGDSGSLLVNASTWALMLTGRVLDDEDEGGVAGALHGMVRRLGEPVIRTAVGRAMREMGAQFVLGRTIGEAMARGRGMEAKGYTYSYDMLGEAARTHEDAARYHGAYAQAITAISGAARHDDIRANPGISVKLSALHPRYEYAHRDSIVPELAGRLLQLARAAKDGGIGLNVDAEEMDRLDLSLDVIAQALSDPSLAGWDGFGVVVQAYGKRAEQVIAWLNGLAQHLDRKIMVRLVKGAYWDTEIKRAQVLGLSGFPVFTHKANTDVSYIGCARLLMQKSDRLYPQFATHNAHTICAVLEMAGPERGHFELQRLHGMGEALHEIVRGRDDVRRRIYAPVGAHRDLLAYLVRRLLENGANSSFVHQIVDEDVPAEDIARDPFVTAIPHHNAAIRNPVDLFAPTRRNSHGWDLTDPLTVTDIEGARGGFSRGYEWRGVDGSGPEQIVRNPANPEDIVGRLRLATKEDAAEAVSRALNAQPAWAGLGVERRADVLSRVADLYESHAPELFALATREAGKTLADGVSEVREAVDFLRYYAAEARTGANAAATVPRGVIVAISPWNFPLAIFTGQIAAALVTGNAVVAKPAEQTPLIAARAVALMHEAGVPAPIVQLICGSGPTVGAALTGDPRVGGVCFTGSTQVARIIERQLANTAPHAMLIAETGGINAMIVDSTALAEQAVRDILISAFQSAGQRCSALRVLYIQRDVEERFLEMLFGAMDTLKVGDPWALQTDVGPIIDSEARNELQTACTEMEARGQLLKRIHVPKTGCFLAPSVFRVSGIGDIPRELFGPILHVARFDADKIGKVIDEINAAGYGLTFGVHSRIDGRVQEVIDGARVGNLYVNRNQIGAIVGSQPFGGEGLSGTGPKAGGPHYLSRFQRSTETASAPPHTPASAQGASVNAEDLRSAVAWLRAEPASTAWAKRTDRVSHLRALLRGKAPEAMSAAAALDIGPLDLPGPTGESNRLTLVRRGVIVCLGPGSAGLDQCVQALRAGNSVVGIWPSARVDLEALIAAGLPCRALDGELAPEALGDSNVGGVAWCGEPAAYRRVLAGQSGALIPLIDARIAPERFVHERVVCIDTTAAGGNTQLLAKVS